MMKFRAAWLVPALIVFAAACSGGDATADADAAMDDAANPCAAAEVVNPCAENPCAADAMGDMAHDAVDGAAEAAGDMVDDAAEAAGDAMDAANPCAEE